MPRTTGPASWLNETAAALGLQTVAPLLDDAERQQQQVQQPAPAVPSFASMVPSLDALLGGPTAPSQPAAAPQQQQQQPSSFLSGLPSLGDLMGGLGLGQQQPVPAASGAPAAMPTTPGSGIPGPDQTAQGVPVRSAGEMGTPAQTGDLRAYTRQKAASLGIDPDIAERVAMSEGGFSDPVRQSDVIAPSGSRETSYGPFQLYVGGGLGDEAIRRGHDPRDPKNIYRNIDFALEHAAQNGWGAFHGAAAVGIGPRQGIGVRPATANVQPAAMPERASQTTQAVVQAGQFTRNQGEAGNALGLSWERTLEICGPVAAAAFLRATGRLPGKEEAEAMRVAQEKGYWQPGRGMGGPGSQSQLLTDLGVANRLENGVDWNKIRADVQRGNPVIVDTPGHYYVVEGYNPQTGEYDLGESARFLRASGGRRWFKPEEIAGLGMGAPRAAIYLDNPETPQPSVGAGRVDPAPAAAPVAPAQPAAPSADPARNFEDKVVVISPEGTRITVPRYMYGEGPGKYAPSKGWTMEESGPVMQRTSLNADAAFPSPASATPPAAPPTAAGGSPLDDARAASYADQPLMARNSLDPSAEAQADTYAPPPPTVPQTMMSPDPTDIRELTAPNVVISQGGPPNGPSVPLYSEEIPPPDLSPQGTPIVSRPMAPSWTYDESPSVGLPEQGQVPPPSPYAPGQAESMEPAPGRFDQPPALSVTAYPGEPDQPPPAPQPTTQTGRGLKPVWDAAGAVVGYVQEAAGKVEEARGNISSTLMDFGIGPAGMLPQRVLPRIEQIEEQAAREVGHDTSTTQGRLTRWRATQDPGWRARNPALAEEYDRLQMEFGLQVVGQAGDAARIGRLARPAQEAAEAGATIGRGGAPPIIIRPQGWEAASDDVATITRPGHYYRGMTEDEFNATLGAGSGVRSRADYSVAREGTSFSHQAQDAESYANFGRDDPRKTGRPTYLVEIAGDEGLRLDRDGYWKAQGEIPTKRITRIIRMEPNDGAVVGTDIPVPSSRPLTNAERVAAADARMAEQGSTSTLGTVGVAPTPARATEPAPVFYSQLRRTIEEKMPNRAGPAQIQGILKGGAVKPDEITWTGLDDWLAEQRGPVTKQQVLDFLDQNEVRVEEVVKGDPLIRWRQEGDALVAAEAPTLRVVQAPDGTYRVEHDGRLSPIPFRTVDEAKAAAQDIATDPAVGLVPKPTATRYDQYTLPGGENYRELLLTLPGGTRAQDEAAMRQFGRPWNELNRAAQELVGREAGQAYRSSHWDEPNVLAHVRFNERTAPDGKRVLMIEEVQSDWHQAGRKHGYNQPPVGRVPDGYTLRPATDDDVANWSSEMGYDIPRGTWVMVDNANTHFLPVDAPPNMNRAQALAHIAAQDEAMGGAGEMIVQEGRVPDAPFKKTWPELAIKRIIRWAAENDFDRIAWSPGAVHAERYSLGNQIDELRWFKSSDPYARGNVRLQGYKGGQQVVDRAASPDELPGLVGQEVARKITGAAETAQNGVLRGTDLQVGGQGMTGFYDEILPATVQKLGKRFGARVGRSELGWDARGGRFAILDENSNEIVGAYPTRQEAQRAIWGMDGEFTIIEPEGKLGSGSVVHSLDITPAMRESVLSAGQPLFVTPGASAGPRGAGALTQLSTDLGNTLSGAAVGATTGAMVPVEATDTNDPMQERLRNMGVGALIGMAGYPALGRLQRRGGGALATPGVGPGRAFDAPNRPPNLGDIPPSQIQEPTLTGMEPPNVRQAIPDVSDVPNRPPVLGDVPPSQIREPMLPGMEPPPLRPPGEVADELALTPEQRTARASAALDEFPQARNWYERARMRNERAMQRQGIEPVSPLRWIADEIGTISYSGMLGPTTASVSTFSGINDLLWSMPKELARGAVRAAQTGNPAALREQGMMHAGARYGMTQLGQAIIDVVKGQGRYAANPNFPRLSERTADPLARLVAGATELPGRLWAGLPDAIFGTVALHSGQAREAAQIATNKGLRGNAWDAEVNRLLTDARATLRGELPTGPEVQQVVEAGERLAKRTAYRDDLGKVGQLGEKFARLGNTPVLGVWASPFYTSLWNAGLRQAERSPIGSVMNTQSRSWRSASFDKVYDTLVGTAVLYALGNYAMGGGVTGSGPSDPKERELLAEKGWQRYSTLTTGLDGEQYYVPNRYYTAFETPLNMAGELHDMLTYRKGDESGADKLADAGRRLGELIRQNPYALSGIVSILEAPRFGVSSFVAEQMTRYTPLAATARAIGTAQDTRERTVDREKGEDLPDEITKRVDEAVQRWQQGVGLRQGLPEAQGAFGQPKENEQPGLWAFAPRIRQAREAPEADIFREARVMPAQPKTEIRPLADDPDLPMIQLSARERRIWDAERGRFLRTVGARLAEHPTWDAAPLEARQAFLKEMMDEANDLADNAVRQQIGADEIRRRVRRAVDLKQKAS